MRRGDPFVFLALLVGCGGLSTAPATTATPPAPPASTQPTTMAAPPRATGGSVVIGEIPAHKEFDPRSALEASKPALLGCYNTVRARAPELSGKLKLRVIVNQAGRAVAVEAEPGGSANDPSLVACIRDVLSAVAFSKPGGMATVIAPLVFRP